MALGTASASPAELASAYTAFAGLGRGVTPRLVRRVENADGEILYETEVESYDALDPAVAYILTDMLRDAVDYGTGNAVRQVGYRGVAAGKTGTTSDGHDAWFIGYTPELVGAVWLGFDRPRPILSNATGGGLAAPVWGRVAVRMQQGRRSPEAWRMPAGVVQRTIDPVSGMPLAEGCRPDRDEAATELFLARFDVETVCPRRGFEPGRWIAGILDRLGIGGDRNRGGDERGRRRGRIDEREIDEAVRELERILGARRAEVDTDRRQRDEEWLRDRRRQRQRDRGGN
jgi:penicillin-binding protein 1A